MRIKLICGIIVFMTVFAISSTPLKAQTKEAVLHELNTLLINTAMEDLFTPPIASRIYVYPNIAFYECIRQEDASLKTLAGKLNGLQTTLPSLPKDNQVDPFIAACISFSYVGQSLVGSEYKFEEWRNKFSDSLKAVTDEQRLKNSMQFGHDMADAVMAWIKKDYYNESRGMMRYVASDKPGSWQPTPLDYAPGMEPHWGKIRPLTLSSAVQFSPKKKLVYSPSKKSVFYKNVKEVYDIVKNIDSTKRAIAWYWDDNPNISVQEGHLVYFVHKISPGGHWIMITRQACLEKNIPVTKASQAYTLTAIALFDAFICCWDEKYKTDLIRPVTVIQHHIDENWVPIIQTPPFPEFTSGHAVISNAAATVLTALLGDNYAFTDNTEIPFGIKPRTFPSFLKAAEETAWSRVYGGIHYPETARISIDQGRLIGKHVLSVYNADDVTSK